MLGQATLHTQGDWLRSWQMWYSLAMSLWLITKINRTKWTIRRRTRSNVDSTLVIAIGRESDQLRNYE